jgi:hypothetical protein
MTVIATGWTECAPALVREQRLVTEVLSGMRKLLPFPWWDSIRTFASLCHQSSRAAPFVRGLTTAPWHIDAVGGRPHGVIAGAKRPEAVSVMDMGGCSPIR